MWGLVDAGFNLWLLVITFGFECDWVVYFVVLLNVGLLVILFVLLVVRSGFICLLLEFPFGFVRFVGLCTLVGVACVVCFVVLFILFVL